MAPASDKKFLLPRHRFFFRILRPVGWLICKLYGYRYEVYPLPKDQNYIILANHQTELDPVFLAMHFRTALYMMATDNVFNKSLASRLLVYALAPIKKEKANPNDIACIRNMVSIAKEGGNIVIFPEGNTAWADYQFYIAPAIAKMVKMTKLPLVLFNLKGGYGAAPRWGHGRRKGSFTGGVREIISAEDIKAMSVEDLQERIVSGLRIIDAESGQAYRSDQRAEYLERLLYICPKCGKIGTLKSQGIHINCSCGLKVEYTEDLHLKSDDSTFPFTKLVDWFDQERRWTADYPLEDKKPDQVIFRDENVTISDKSNGRRIQLSQGDAVLTPSTFSVGEVSIPTSEIRLFTAFGNGKLNVSTKDASYFIQGDPRFNAIKYLLMFNRFMEKEDLYYGIYSDLLR